jgi:pimeloyl-ACP methyl ester carboxylesterase
VTPFKINAPLSKLDHIRDRVAAYPWFPAPADEGDGWGRGVNTAVLRDLCEHWLRRYDWRAAEADLNRWPHFIATIDGLDIHFVHVVGEARGKRPLLITHGWPGSIYEFWGVIERLAFPSRHGGSAQDAFDLVIPSLPGYGFSGKPTNLVGQRATAKMVRTLMIEVLGYERFLAQGGDWGGMVTSWLGFDHADVVAGIHLNMIGLRPTPGAPQSDEEKDWLTRTQFAMQAEGAYFYQQATKPQTLAMALMDSPVGAAAWILEKFHGWSDLKNGDLWSVYTRDQLITNIMIYLVTDSMATSVRYYRALFEENGGVALPEGKRVEVATGFAHFPGETLYAPPPRSWAERAYHVVQWTQMPGGGHFAAMERPVELADDVKAFAAAIGY